MTKRNIKLVIVKVKKSEEVVKSHNGPYPERRCHIKDVTDDKNGFFNTKVNSIQSSASARGLRNEVCDMNVSSRK